MFKIIITFLGHVRHAIRQIILIDYCNAIRRLTAGRIHFKDLDVDTSHMKNVSDGYHTFDELYRHRAALFAVVINTYKDYYTTWKSKQHHDGTMFDDMFIVGILSPRGQITYHYHTDKEWDLFDCPIVDRAPVWDGHTPEDCIGRLRSLHIPKYVYVLQAASKATTDHVGDMCDMTMVDGIAVQQRVFDTYGTETECLHRNYGLLNGAGTVALVDFDYDALWHVLKVDSHPSNMQTFTGLCRFTDCIVVASGNLRDMAAHIQTLIPKELHSAVIGSEKFDYAKYGISIPDTGNKTITCGTLCHFETSRPGVWCVAGAYSYVRTGKKGRSGVSGYGHAVTHKTGMARAGVGGKITFEWRETDNRHQRTFYVGVNGVSPHVWYSYDQLAGRDKTETLTY